jgi:hypothetical protein
MLARIAPLLLILLAACGSEGRRDPSPGGGRDSATVAARHARELIFVGEWRREPLVAPIVFRTVEGDSVRAREIRGWLARGKRWETFVDEQWTAPAVGSPWTVVPHGDLRIAAGGATGVESLWFDRAGRSLRLNIAQVLGQWNRGSTSRLHLLGGRLSVGGEPTRGVVVELLRIRRPSLEEPGISQQLILTSGDSLLLLVDRGTGRGRDGGSFVWLRDGSGAREWNAMRVQTRGARALPDARREIPRAWTVTVPEAGLTLDVQGLGFAAEIGAERAGRREVEARYTVRGWLEREGRRTPVSGLARQAVD